MVSMLGQDMLCMHCALDTSPICTCAYEVAVTLPWMEVVIFLVQETPDLFLLAQYLQTNSLNITKYSLRSSHIRVEH